MYDGGKILIGLLVFAALLLFPVWYNLASSSPTGLPELGKPVKGERCLLDTEQMRADHMALLDDWRDLVVRDGVRTYTNPHGEDFEMSLSHTCLDCHADKAAFCDRCHTFMGVEPYCWDCHIVPQEVTDGA